MQKHVNLVDLVKSFPTNIFLQNLAPIQKRTSPMKFANLAEKSDNGSISNLSTKVLIAFLKAGALFASIIISLVTIASAWIAYRPKLCGSIVVLLVLGSIDSKYYCDYLNVFCDLK